MQLEATLNIEELSAAEVAQFELKCRELRSTPERTAADLIRAFNGTTRRSSAATTAATDAGTIATVRRTSAATETAGRRATPRKRATRKGAAA